MAESAETNPLPSLQSQEEMWNEIGFHKPLAGFWYKVILTIIGLFIGVFFTQLVYNIFFPWPETQGYGNNVSNLFALYITLMGVANSGTLNQFMPEARIKSPRKMLGYIQFAMWYQLFTGIIEVSYDQCICLNLGTIRFIGVHRLVNVIVHNPTIYGCFRKFSEHSSESPIL